MNAAKIDSSRDNLSGPAESAVLALSVLIECIESRHTAVLALPVLIDRIQLLPSADRDALYELLVGMAKAENAEEKQDIVSAMEEILIQAPVVVHQMEMDDGPMPKGLKAWSEHVGKRVRELRKQASMNQSQLAEKAGLDQSHISRIENAAYSATHMTLEKIADALGVSVRELDARID